MPRVLPASVMVADNVAIGVRSIFVRPVPVCPLPDDLREALAASTAIRVRTDPSQGQRILALYGYA